MKISVFGTGYVGLVTAACLVKADFSVSCFDIDESRIDLLKKGVVPIFEPGLTDLVSSGLEKEGLSFTTVASKSLSDADAIIVCVGTPDLGTGETNLDSILSAAEIIGENLTEICPILIKSTVPVGTGSLFEQKIKSILVERGLKLDVLVASNPEFLHEGSAIKEFEDPDRVVVGATDEKLISVCRQIYDKFIADDNKFIVMTRESSEMTKYASNCFLATKISFMNELSHFCLKTGANVDEVRRGMGPDPAIAERYLFAGCGFGGSCLPKDVSSMIHQSQTYDAELSILKSVRAVNERQKEYLVELARDCFNRNLEDVVVSIWGLSFKPDTDDMRGAASLVVIKKLLEYGAIVRAFDPLLSRKAEDFEIQDERFSILNTMEDALIKSSCLIICTEWDHFKSPDYSLLLKLMQRPLILDGRNLLEPQEPKQNGFEYYDIGRSPHYQKA